MDHDDELFLKSSIADLKFSSNRLNDYVTSEHTFITELSTQAKKLSDNQTELLERIELSTNTLNGRLMSAEIMKKV